MKHITIAHRITMMIGASVLTLLMVGGVGLFVAHQASNSIKQLNAVSLTGIHLLADARQAFMELRLNAFFHVLNTEEFARPNIEKTLKANTADISKRLREYETLLPSEEERQKFQKDFTELGEYLDFINNQVLPKSRTMESDAALQLLTTIGYILGQEVKRVFDEQIALNIKNSDESSAKALSEARQGNIVSLAVIVAGVIAVGALGIFLLLNIKSSLRQIQTMVSRVESELDFTIRVPVTKQDEIGQTTSALNRLLDKLQDNLKSIATSATSVASSSHQMATTSNQVATASHQQSEAASEMAATVEEMTVSINHVADRALEANQLSSKSGELAHSGEQIIGQTVSDIQDIATTVHEAAAIIQGLEKNSEQITKVVAVIKDVADQTNLLALNAAIEAARAGEQGRGFAVVADEVRKLAERTATSTMEIARTIATMRTGAGDAVASMEGVMAKVSVGVQRAHEANASIKQIGKGSRDAVVLVEEITSAIREQGSATNNIATRVERIAQMSEESSAAAGNSAQTAQDLDQLARDMQAIVRAYKL